MTDLHPIRAHSASGRNLAIKRTIHNLLTSCLDEDDLSVLGLQGLLDNPDTSLLVAGKSRIDAYTKRKQLSAIKENVISDVIPSAIAAIDGDLPTTVQTSQPAATTPSTVPDPAKEITALKETLRKKNFEIRKLKEQGRHPSYTTPPPRSYATPPPDYVFQRTKEGYKPKELLDFQCDSCQANDRYMKRCFHCRRHSTRNKPILFNECQDPVCLENKTRRKPPSKQ